MNVQNTDNIIITHCNKLYQGIDQLIHDTKHRVSIYLNSETTLLYWGIGAYINNELKQEIRHEYGAKILATLSQ